MPKKVVCLGGMGDPVSIAKAIDDANERDEKEWEFVGFLNDIIDKGTTVDKYPVLGKLDSVQDFIEKDYYFINAIYRIDGNKRRIRIFEKLKIPKSRLATFIHPTAYVAPGVEFGPGCVIMPNVSISPGVKFGIGCIVLQGATIGHNTHISDYCHISAQACVGAYSKIGRGVHIGMNSTFLENLEIGDYSALGMGSVLLRNIGREEIWFGVPARFLRKPGEK